MSKQVLHIIEPTLFDQTGHGYSYVNSLLLANTQFDINVWLDKRGANLLSKTLCTAHLYFWRPLRQMQKLFLYYKLLRSQDIIFVCTSDLWDLRVFSFWSKLCGARSKVVLHFHQFKQAPKKMAILRKLSFNNKITMITPTTKLSQVFIDAGYRCTTMPCPTFYPQRNVDEMNTKFSKLLYAGAARSDKGFATVIQLLQDMRSKQNYMPFEIQVSAPNSQRYDADTTNALQILATIPDTNLVLHKHTLSQEQYLTQFNNAICLLLYDNQGYNDKFSGVALDAFYAGCPVITVSNTWMGDTATQYQAGIALDNCQLDNIQNAINTIVNNYAFYQQNAKNAAISLQQLHDPANTLRCLER